MDSQHTHAVGELSPSVLFVTLVCLVILRWLGTALYRLCLSPVASIPGPRLAAITFWYEFYYDVWRKGQYTWKLKDLHKEYGKFSALNSSKVIYRLQANSFVQDPSSESIPPKFI